MSLLENIQKPADIKNFSDNELWRLRNEIFHKILDTVKVNGGHLASNLGTIELTIALHYVFNSPDDKIIWDVGHQSYSHKLLTGRVKQFSTLRNKNGISGFPRRAESCHDITDTGHSSTSISSALGFSIAKQLDNDKHMTIAVIGDGSLNSGQAFEGLNHAGHLKSPLIIILNDNQMSIDRNIGGVSAYLSKIVATQFYQKFQHYFDENVVKIPLIGKPFLRFAWKIKKIAKAMIFPRTIFSDMGLEYIGPLDGHDIKKLINVFKRVQKLRVPVLIHINTIKGKGYKPAEQNPTSFHGVSPYQTVDGKLEKKMCMTFTEVFSEIMLENAAKYSNLVAITAAMAEGTGLKTFAEEYPRRFFDVGIAEQHAVTFSAGLALGGLKPVLAIYSTFLQRGIDQIVQDVAISSVPVVFAIDRAGIVGQDGETHQGQFDLSYLLMVPNMVILAPSDYLEMKLMFSFAFNSKFPVAIRYPRAMAPMNLMGAYTQLETGKGVLLFPGEDVLIISVGSLLEQVLKAKKELDKTGINVGVYNLRYIKPLNESFLINILNSYKKVIIIEENSIISGAGTEIIKIINRAKLSLEVIQCAIPDQFIEHARREEILHDLNLDSMGIIRTVKNLCLSSIKL